MDAIFKYIDANVDKWVNNLSEAVAIKSVSTWTETRPEVERMVRLARSRLEHLGATVEFCDIGFQVDRLTT